MIKSWTKTSIEPPPKDKPLWLYHPGWAGGAVAVYWNKRNKWWSAIDGAGSHLICSDQATHWMLRTEPPGPPEDGE